MGSDPRTGKKVVRGKVNTAPRVPSDYALDDAFELFFSVKKSEGMRKRTLDDYRTHWRYFRRWIDENYAEIKLREVTSKVLREYVSYMADGRTKYAGVEKRVMDGVKLAPATVAIRLRTLTTMFTFWTTERMLDINPIAHIKPPKHDEEELRTFTEDQFRNLVAAPDMRTYAGLRDRTLILTLADGGFRIEEAVRLKPEFLDIKARWIELPGWMNKNRKPRIVPISADVIRELITLMNENRRYFGDVEYIFLSNYGDRLKSDQFRKRLKQHANRVGIDSDEVQVSPHQFRSFFLTQFLMGGGDLFSAQKIVAHASIQTTRRYVKLNNEDIRQQHTLYSPIARLGMTRVGKRK